VPLQRLFFMNSEFMQQHAEKLAEKVTDAADDTERIRKVYRLIFGRAPTEAEITAGREFLRAEGLKQYEDRRAELKKPQSDKDAGKDKAAENVTAADAAPMEGMMAGVVPGVKSATPAEKMLPVTVFGRYVKILLSSNEFLFVS
jgi:hypothetical protein